MNDRRRITGVVTSNKMTKTVVVEIRPDIPAPSLPQGCPSEQACQGS